MDSNQTKGKGLEKKGEPERREEAVRHKRKLDLSDGRSYFHYGDLPHQANKNGFAVSENPEPKLKKEPRGGESIWAGGGLGKRRGTW